MHTVSPYSIRCFNPAIQADKIEKKYSVLDKIGQLDAYALLKQFIESKSAAFSIVEDSKQIYRFTDVTFDEHNRLIYGWLQVGGYGQKTEIIDIETSTVDFEKAEKHADVIRHYIYFYVPIGCNEGIALMHAVRGNGVKTLFIEQFQPFFTNRTTLKLQMNPLTYDKAFEEWKNANTKEIRATKFSGLNDIADQVKKLGHDEKDIVFKAPKRGMLGKFSDFLSGDTEQMRLIEMLLPQCEQIKTVVELNGKKRTFRVGTAASRGICDIEVPDSVKLVQGNPEYHSIRNWCAEIMGEFSVHMYPVLKEIA